MRSHATALLVAAFAALYPAPLQQDPPVPPRRVIGLVEVPSLFGESGDADRRNAAVMLFHEPSERSSAAATIRRREDFEVREHDYEMLSGVVHGRRAGWFLMRAKGRFAWLSPRDAGEFRGYPQLVLTRLAYLTDAWDRALYDEPGGSIAARVPVQPDPSTGDPDWLWGSQAARPSNVSMVALREHAGEWWARVQVGPSICESETDPPPVVAEGWVPAYGKSGNPTLWFYSRGC
jgi:hypothetical protein